MAKDGGEELNLNLTLDLSLGGGSSSSSSALKNPNKFPSLVKYPSENLQPCLRKFATESFFPCKDNNSGSKKDDREDLRIPPWSLGTKNESLNQEKKPSPFGYGVSSSQQPPRILRTCSSSAVGMGMGMGMTTSTTKCNESFLQRQSSCDLLDRKRGHTEMLEMQKKRETQAMRRQEARKKRDEKQKKAKREEVTNRVLPLPGSNKLTDLVEIQRSLMRDKDISNNVIMRSKSEAFVKEYPELLRCKDEQEDGGETVPLALPLSLHESKRFVAEESSAKVLPVSMNMNCGYSLPPTYVSPKEASIHSTQQHVYANGGFAPFQSGNNGSLPGWMKAPGSGSGSGQLTPPSRTSSGKIPDQESRSSEGTSSDDTKGHSSNASDKASVVFHSLSRVPSFNTLQSKLLAYSESNTNSKKEPCHYSNNVEMMPSSAFPSMESSSSLTSWEKKCETSSRNSSRIPCHTSNKSQNSTSNHTSSHNKMDNHDVVSKSSTEANADKSNGYNSPSAGGSPANMPFYWVSTTGPGPNGTTVTGILYSYSRSQVKIICSCHGTSMTPAEFVQHAGSTDISNPERSIVVNPIGISTTLARG